jgi:hypothetical protein
VLEEEVTMGMNALATISARLYSALALLTVLLAVATIAVAHRLLPANLTLQLGIGGACWCVLTLIEIRYRVAPRALNVVSLALFGALLLALTATTHLGTQPATQVYAFIAYSLAMSLVLRRAERGESSARENDRASGAQQIVRGGRVSGTLVCAVRALLVRARKAAHAA